MGNTKTVGKLDSWDNGDVGSQTSFLNLEEGSNIMRVVSSPWQTYSHFTLDATGQNRKVQCALKDCPVCARGEESKPRWLIAVLSRKTGNVMVLEIGPQVFKQIRDLAKKPKWGDVRGYDIDIVKGPKGSQPLYIVSPEPKEPLEQSDKDKVKAAMEKFDLQKLTAAPTPEELCEKLGIAQKANVAAVEEDVPADNDDSDFNFDFSK